ncbi:MAG: hypothetical protein ABFS37_00555 [Acidobacteriota bacterium]
MGPGQESLSIAVERHGVGVPGSIDHRGKLAGRTLEGDIQAIARFDQPESRCGWGGRLGDFDKACRQQSGSRHDQANQASDKTDDPRSFQWAREDIPCGSAERPETEESPASSAAEYPLRGGSDTLVAEPTTAGSAAVLRLVGGMNGAVTSDQHLSGAEGVGSSAPGDYTMGIDS